MNLNFFLALTLSMIITFSCSDKKNETEENWDIVASSIPLNDRLDILLVGIMKLRAETKASEDEKVKTTKMLIDEIALTLNEYNRKLYENIKKTHEVMKKSLYTEENMDDEKVVEAYDVATAHMIAAINIFVEKTPEFNHYTRSKILYDAIIKADASDFKIRKDYNAYVSEFNAILEDKEEEIKKLGGKYLNFKKEKLFYGGDLIL